MSVSILRPKDAHHARAQLLAAHVQVGVRRKAIRTILDRISTDASFDAVGTPGEDGHVPAKSIFGLSYDKANAFVDHFGRSIERPDKDVYVPYDIHSAITDEMIAGAAYGNKMVGNLVIPCGVCLIVGAGGVGKTPLAHALAGHGVDDYAAVRVGEPFAGYSSSNKSSARDLASALYRSADIVLDSIKDLLSGGSGAAMKSGLSRDALTTLSAWAALANAMGSTIYIPVNPSTPDPEVTTLLVEAARSNATMTIAHTGGPEWKCYARQGEGLDRTTAAIRLKWDSQGAPIVDVSGSSIREMSEVEAGISLSATVDNMTGLLSRVLSSTKSPIDE